MASLQTDRVVTGGVDTHRDVHVAAVLDQLGRVLATGSFPATPVGYRTLTAWMGSYGTIGVVGVEGTGVWGAGLSRHLESVSVRVVEVTRPNRQRRRRYGKTDTTDAISAAKAVLSGEATSPPRGGTGPVESLRLLRIARRSAMKQRTAVGNQIHAVLVTAPDQIRTRHQGLNLTQTVKIAARYRPADPSIPPRQPNSPSKHSQCVTSTSHKNWPPSPQTPPRSSKQPHPKDCSTCAESDPTSPPTC